MPRTMPPAPDTRNDADPLRMHERVFGPGSRPTVLTTLADGLGLNHVLIGHGLHPDHPPDREPRPPRA